MVAEPSKSLTQSRIVLPTNQPQTIDFRTRGRSGLHIYGGYVFEEKLRELQGDRAIETFQEMVDQDATCGSISYVIDKLVRQTPWKTERASDHPNDRQAQDFLDECWDDMDITPSDLMSEIFRMTQDGFSIHELVYKRRGGDAEEGYLRSKYKDGRVGWRSISPRAASTIKRWLTDDLGNFVGVEQQSPPNYTPVIIPWEKLLHFRTSVSKNNPLGRSIYRSAYRQWYLKRGLENVEAIGAERSLAGLPQMRVPSEVIAQLDPDAAANYKRCEEIVTGVRRDEQEGMIIPSDRDDRGNLLYEFLLTPGPGGSNVDTDKMISRYDQRIAMSVLADFLLLGAGSTGSFAMHADKSALFSQSLNALMDIVEQVLNRFAVSRLFKLNNFTIDEFPRFRHGKVGQASLKDVGEFLANITRAGAAVLPNAAAEERLMEMADLPFTNPDNQGPIVDPLPTTNPRKVEEHHEGDPDLAVEQMTNRADTVMTPNTAQNQSVRT